MLTLAHAGQPVAPHDVWTAWDADPLLVAAVLVAAWVYRRGRAPGHRSSVRAWAFGAGLAAAAVAVLSPLDAMSAALASAHMVQHVLLILVAAPLLAFAAPGSALLRGAPAGLRRAIGRWRRRWSVRPLLELLRHPVWAWVLHVGVIWIWHAAVLYDAALRVDALHALEHATFLGSALLFWRAVVGARTADGASYGAGLVLVFGMALQSVFLSALLTFARTPWYAAYATTTQAWGLQPLADQQLAGVIMWVPAGAIYLLAGLLLLGAWIRGADTPRFSLDTAAGLPLSKENRAGGGGGTDGTRTGSGHDVGLGW